MKKLVLLGALIATFGLIGDVGAEPRMVLIEELTNTG